MDPARATERLSRGRDRDDRGIARLVVVGGVVVEIVTRLPARVGPPAGPARAR
ncbi:hypothetical protein OG985_24145 [Streptomyces sp. NBC_00289]|uniref:hypothetical protein n=1 Tax=Streptomyces sp. NBC_00289 TaxID=2975703 RepID=UPI0032437189